MSATTDFVVHVYHININTGDGQIILLVDDRTKTALRRGTVHAASLLDGGKGGDATQMIKVINEINAKYLFADDKHFDGTLKFDSVIISHWDVDHYQGVFGVLRTGFLKSINKANAIYNMENPTLPKIKEDTIPLGNVTLVPGAPPRVPPTKGGGDDDDDAPPPPPKKSPKAKKDSKGSSSSAAPKVTLPGLRNTYRTTSYTNAFLKYTNVDGATWTCLSTIYSPYWNAHFDPEAIKKKTTGKRKKGGEGVASPHGAAWSSLTTMTPKYKVAGELLTVTGDAPYTPLPLTTTKIKTPFRTADLALKVNVQGADLETVRFVMLANLISHRSELLGVNFFTNQLPSSGSPLQWRAFKDTKALVEAHRVSSGIPAVGLYCIGADGEVLDASSSKDDAKNMKRFKATGAVLTPVGPPDTLPLPTIPLDPSGPIVLDHDGNGSGGSSSKVGMKKSAAVQQGSGSVKSHINPIIHRGMPSSKGTDDGDSSPLLARESLSTSSAPKKRPGFRPPVRVVDEDTSTGTNRSSIIAAVIFDDGRTQEYLGGDADYPVEIAAASWLNQRVPLVKLSHHGAVHSTPLPLITILNPDRIMCSAGDTKSYAHPRWETVLFFHLRERIRQNMWSPFNPFPSVTPAVTKLPVFQKPFYNTMYPIWMSDESKFSIDTFEVIQNVKNALSPTAIFVKALYGMWKILNVADSNTLYEVVNRTRADILEAKYGELPPTRKKPIIKHKKPKKGALSEAQLDDNEWLKMVENMERIASRAKITAELVEAWKEISYIDSRFGQPGSKKAKGASSSTVTADDSILYFLAKLSKPGKNFDPTPGPDLNFILPRNSTPNENIGVDITAWSDTGEIELFPPGTHVMAIDPLVDLAPIDLTDAPVVGFDPLLALSNDLPNVDDLLNDSGSNYWLDYVPSFSPSSSQDDMALSINSLLPADTGLLSFSERPSEPEMDEDSGLSFSLVRDQYWYALDRSNSDDNVPDPLGESKMQVGMWKNDELAQTYTYGGIFDNWNADLRPSPLTSALWNQATAEWQDLIVDGDRDIMDATGQTWSDVLDPDDMRTMSFVSKSIATSAHIDSAVSEDTLVIREVASSNNSSATPGPFPATFSTKMASTANVPGSIQAPSAQKSVLSTASAADPPTAVKAAAKPSIVFYMSSKRFPASVESTSQIILKRNSMPEYFVTRLEKGFIATKSALAGDSVGVDLADNDKLALRLGYNGLGGVLSIYGADKTITAFSLKVSMSIAGKAPSPAWDLIFDSRSVNAVFGRPEIESPAPANPSPGEAPAAIEAPASLSAPPESAIAAATERSTAGLSIDTHGVLPPASTLVMGLKTVGFKTKLTHVLKVFDFPFSQLLGFDSDIDLDLTVGNANSRNAVWIYSNLRYTSVIRLEMQVAEAQVQRVTDLLKNISSSISLVGVKVVVVRTSNCNTTGNKTSVVMDPRLSVAATVRFSEGFQFTSTMIFSPASLRLVLTNDLSYTIQEMADWLSRLLGVPGDFWNWIPGLDDIILKQITISLQGQKLTKGNFKIEFEVALKFGKAGKKVVFMLSFSGPPFRFSGIMWTKFSMDGLLPAARALDPNWEPYMTLVPTSGGLSPPYTDLADSVSLLELIPGVTITAQPKWLPLNLAAVSLRVDEKAMQFSGTLVCPPAEEGDIPPINFDTLSLTAWYDRTTAKGNPANFWILLEGGVTVTAKDNKDQRAEIDAAVKYDSARSEWSIHGSVRDLNLGMLWSFFDAADRGLMADILKRITVRQLDILYQFRSGKNVSLPSSLAINGTIELGSLQLILQYKHMGKDPVTGKAEWALRAFLGSAQGAVETIGSIADSILGDSVADILPPFIANVEIDLGEGGGPEDAPLQLSVEKGDELMVLSVRIQLSQTMSITFVQATKQPVPGAIKPFSPKRIIRFTLDGFPTISGIPLLNSLPQPFDEMHYVWVQDSNTDPTNKAFVPGLTQKEIDSINWILPDADQIPYKATLKPPEAGKVAGGAPSPVVLRAGHHFMVVSSGAVSLDYLFNATKPAPAPARPLRTLHRPGINIRAVAPKPAPAPEPADNNVAMGTMQKSIGPLSIANVGLQYKKGILWLFLDATVHLGPIEFALLGLGIGLDLSQVTLDNIADFFKKLPGAIHLQLNGMGLGFSQPPVTAIGVFMKAVDRKAYMGGVALSFLPYTFLAVGAYEEKEKPSGGSYKSVFVFAKLDGPLITLEFAVLSGVKLGFGYNSKIRFPSVSEVTTFPFVADAAIGAKPDPIAVLQTITAGNWVTPEENQLWMAAGLKVLAFEAVSISAVACITFGASSLALGIFAQAVARMPTNAPIESCFINVELGIVVYVDFLGGIFRAEAQLSPNSFVICPDCHLTGGFALCYWFPGSEHVGDWVFTIGGYHRSFDVPDHYPRPPRLGISWQLDDCLSITGEAYFAITPKACMGGGRLEVVFSCGPIYAYLNAYADFLINFKPFKFIGDVGVSVGVEFEVDLGLIEFTISVDVGCDLHLEGPPFGGVAHIDFYLFAFDIRFGPRPGLAPALSLEEFYTFVKETGPKSAPVKSDTSDPAQSLLLFNLEDGAVPEAATSKSAPGDPWVVRAGTFQFRVSTPFALSLAHCNAANLENKVPFYAKPMRVTTPVVSELTITITANNDKTRAHKFRVTKLMKDVPAAAWDKYDPNQDPASSPADSLLSPANSTSSQLMGLIITHPDPILSADTIPAFNAHDAMNEDIFPDVANPLLPSRPPTQEAWIPSVPIKSDLADYQGVAKAWSDAPLKALVGDLVATWIDVLDWDLGAPEDSVLKVKAAGQKKGVPRTVLNDLPPEEILLKDFETYYVGCPAVTGIVAG